MATYVVRFLEGAAGEFRGRVRRVSTGEEASFTRPEELYDFFDRLNAADGLAAPLPPGARKDDEPR